MDRRGCGDEAAVTPHRHAWRWAMLAALPLAAAALAVLPAAPAHAADYRYWSFWERRGTTWQFAPGGPAATRPADGAVEGWRFGVSTPSAGVAPPRGTADFAVICAATTARPGLKRLAIVLDFGTQQDAPDGDIPPQQHTACAQLPPAASAADALAAVAKPLRYDGSGLLCAIAGYPHSGCGERLAPSPPPGTATPSPTATAHAGSERHGTVPYLAPAAALAAAAALGAAALRRARRRRR